ncbi:adenylyltransferase/cytidyltransferase family protein [Ruania halotolerans]|uniref:adenylyltransferase/cytidyltransferase family protein n=1 Tax=Ruania halotolerans TaxID=2897773 RepID=UPI001E380E12|nr:adenylyltransferase/cytidyltransferase family protein [Ruania halotolerans]UFU05728.1 adenylyltransferase/cytidyltransferase family protein [Ruania halotolerans]
MTVGYVPGGFDLFHIGHLNILREARRRCDVLIAGVATDESLLEMKGREPVIPFQERLEVVATLRLVDHAVADTSQDKRVAWRANPFDVLFKGDDWRDTYKGALLEQEMAEVGARVVYFPYTQRTSSTILRRFIYDSLDSKGA